MCVQKDGRGIDTQHLDQAAVSMRIERERENGYVQGPRSQLSCSSYKRIYYVKGTHDVDMQHAGAMPSKLITEGSDGNISISYRSGGFLNCFLTE